MLTSASLFVLMMVPVFVMMLLSLLVSFCEQKTV